MTAISSPAFKKAAPWAIVFFILLALAGGLHLLKKSSVPAPVPYSELVKRATAQEIEKLLIKGDQATAVTKGGQVLRVVISHDSSDLVNASVSAGVEVHYLKEEGPSAIGSFLSNWGPALLLVAALAFFARQRAGGTNPGKALSVGRSRAKLVEAGSSPITFADVAGCDEAKQEVSEVVEFLRNPAKFEALGGRIPRGVLLGGPPGTGKTLLARAIAGEAKVPFLTLSGSDFVEMFQGVGASRVRDLFRQAKQHAPCIIFIDEIDAVGRQRSNQSGNSDERDQTLNQLLVEMDGFEKGQGVILIAATNRADILDPALLRPGRFDRQVTVGLPDVRGREQILQVHLAKVAASSSLDVPTLARGTPGFSGAELGNLVNEAALIAAQANKKSIDMEDLEKAKDKLLMGVERQSLRMSESERSATAYHEAGHALAAKLLQHTDPLHKVSIIPRGAALGVTVQLPESDRYSLSRGRILDSIVMLFAGRVAEELFTSDITTGASNDYERATAYARNMVTKWGMSEALGPCIVSRQDAAPDTLRAVDAQITEILRIQYQRAHDLLERHRDAMTALRDALMTHETLDATQVHDIVSRHVPPGTPVHHAPFKH